MKIIWTQKAFDQFSEIHNYIKSDSPISAAKWAGALFDQVSKLESLPKMGRKLPEIKTENIREIIYGNYRIIYKISDESIQLMAIRHFKQFFIVEDLSE